MNTYTPTALQRALRRHKRSDARKNLHWLAFGIGLGIVLTLVVKAIVEIARLM
jgi:hypothetical protein